MRVTVLGCGPSGGVPLVGCDCAVCTSSDPRDRRSRASILVEDGATRILVDTAPDLREQLLRERVTSLSAVLFTHEHADHTHGIDELRSINYLMDRSLPAWADARTMGLLRARFAYIFEGREDEARDRLWFKPRLVPHVIDGPFHVAEVPVLPFRQLHGGGREPTLGFRFGDFAYSTDVKEMPEEAFAALDGVRVWIVDCLRETPNWAHSHLEQTLSWIERVKPERALLTHMNHEMGYAALKARLPEGVEPAYDGMRLEIRGA